MIRGGVEILRRALVLFDRAHFGIAAVHRAAAEADQRFQHLLPSACWPGASIFRRRWDGSLLVRPISKALDFELSLEFDDGVEDALHDVRIDQMALRFDDFRNGHSFSMLTLRIYLPDGLPRDKQAVGRNIFPVGDELAGHLAAMPAAAVSPVRSRWNHFSHAGVFSLPQCSAFLSMITIRPPGRTTGTSRATAFSMSTACSSDSVA